MKRLRFSAEDTSEGHLLLVNPLHPLSSDIPSSRLVPIRGDAPRVLLERQAPRMLCQVMTALGCGREIVPVSGYRTMQEQQAIYSDSLREHGEDFTSKYVAFPGCSEHQTGLAIDLGELREDIDFLRPSFPYTGICGRFRDLSVRYGFIERYPAGRQQVTHIAHEPWHFRYVGYPHSEMIVESGLTLEEYTDYLKQFRYQDKHLSLRRHGHDFEIFYVPVGDSSEAGVHEADGSDATALIPDGVAYQVSGNNDGGVVVTLWRG